jgi:hypothetical protein
MNTTIKLIESISDYTGSQRRLKIKDKRFFGIMEITITNTV